MKTRVVFTVTRECGDESAEEFKESASMIQDEAGEYLYGGRGGDERVAVAFQVSEDGEHWLDFHPHLKPCFVRMTYDKEQL